MPSFASKNFLSFWNAERFGSKTTLEICSYKGLTLDEMEKYITAQDNSDEGLKAFEAIKVYHTPKGKEKPSYPKVKAWFLKTYPKYGKKETVENPAA